MRKFILSFIITMSLLQTSGIHSFTAQERLEQTLQGLNPTRLKIQITEWYPKSALDSQANERSARSLAELTPGMQVVKRETGNEPKVLVINTYTLANTSGLLDNYSAIRTEAQSLSGDARLEISTEFHGDQTQLRDVGRQLLNNLGADNIAQEVEDPQIEGELANQGWLMYSGVSFINGWGKPISVDNPISVKDDTMNVEILLRPSDDGTGLKLSIYAPVLQS